LKTGLECIREPGEPDIVASLAQPGTPENKSIPAGDHGAEESRRQVKPGGLPGQLMKH